MTNSSERTWTINHREQTVTVSGMRRLIDVLRDDLNIKSVKEGCGEGECGACTVLINDIPVTSCLVAAAQVPDGAVIMTAEGLGETRIGKILQQAYLEKGASQCGFCIPGIIMSSYALLLANPDPDENEIRTAHAGNLCRCTGYEKIVEAVQHAATVLRT